jgi:hypothetical protein
MRRPTYALESPEFKLSPEFKTASVKPRRSARLDRCWPRWFLFYRVDAFWAVKQLAAFTDDDIRALVSTGEYSDPNDSAYVAATLMLRRDSILRAYLTRVLPIDHFIIEEDRLAFQDLAASLGLVAVREYRVSWSLYYASTGSIKPASSDGTRVPEIAEEVAEHGYLIATVRYACSSTTDRDLETTVYLRHTGQTWTAAGVDRKW